MKIPGYSTLEKLSQGKSFAVYRAKKEKDNSPYILKTLDKKTALPGAAGKQTGKKSFRLSAFM